jgi:hypothetical protein
MEWLLMKYRKTSKAKAVAFAACAGALLVWLGCHRPSQSHAQALIKLWTVDFSGDRDFHKRANVPEADLASPFIHFLTNSRLICDFYDPETTDRNSVSREPSYHVLEIDANKGTFGRKLDFKSITERSKTLATADGGFVVLNGETLNKFDSQFNLSATFPTPVDSWTEKHDVWLLDAAPSGHTLLLYHRNADKENGEWTWLRTTDLSVINSRLGPRANTIGASDTAGLSGLIATTLFSSDRSIPVCDLCIAHFLSNDALFLDRQREYSIQTIAGKQIASGGLNVEANDFSRSMATTRIAYSTSHYVGSGFPVQTNFNAVSSNIIVLDWSTNKRLAELEIDEPVVDNPSVGFKQMALALSPDGQYLAVLLHRTLTLYRLP